MARLWSSGIELQSVTSGVEFSGVGGDISIDVNVPHNAGGTCLIAGGVDTPLLSGAAQYVEHQFAAANGNGPYYFRAYVRIHTAPSAENRIIALLDSGGTVRAYVTIDASRQLRLYDEDGVIGSASSAISTGTWYRVEMLFDASASAGSHVLRARIDGSEFAGSTARSISTGVTTFRIGGNLASEAQTTGRWYFDDLAINDATGSYQTSYPGNGYIECHRPNGFEDYTGGNSVGGSLDMCIKEIPPDDASSYYQLLADTDMFRMYNTASHSIHAVKLVQIGIRARGADANPASLKVRVMSPRDGYTAYQEATVALATASFVTNADTAPKNYPLTSYVSPVTGEPWADDEVYDGNFGAYAVDATPDIDITTMWWLAEYDDDHLVFHDGFELFQSYNKYKNGLEIRNFFIDMLEASWGWQYSLYLDDEQLDGIGESVAQFSLVDSIRAGKNFLKALTESLNLTATITSFKIFIKQFIESIGIAIGILKKATKVFADSTTLTPAITATKVTNRYWVGGTGNINDTAHWSLTSGGASGASVPTAAENAIFDAASFAADGTVTFNVDFTCRNLDCSALDQVVAFTASSPSKNINVYGSLACDSAMTFSSLTVVRMLSVASETIALNGISTNLYIYLSGGGVYTFTSGGTIRTLFPNNGTCDFNGQTLVCDNGIQLQDIAGTTFLIFGAATITTNSFSLARSTNTVFIDPGTASMAVGTGGIYDASAGNYPKSLYDVSIDCSVAQSSGFSLPSINGKFTFHNLTLTGSAIRDAATEILYDTIVTGTFTATGNSILNRLRIQKTLYGSVVTPVIITAAAVSLANVDFRQITGAGAAAPFTGTSLGNSGLNTGITFDTPVTRYWVGGTGDYSDTAHWAASSNGAGGVSVPLPQDTVIFDANSLSANDSVITLDYVHFGASVNLSALTKTLAFVFQDYHVFLYGNFTSSNLVSWTSESLYPMLRITGGGSNINLRFNTVNFPASILLSNGGGTVTLLDSVSISGTTSIYDADFDLNGNSFTTEEITLWLYSGSICKLHMGEGSLTTRRFSANSGATIYWETATIFLINENAGVAETLFLLCANVGTPYQVVISSKNLQWYGGMNTIQRLVFNSGARVLIDQQTISITNALTINGLDADLVTLSAYPASYFYFSAASGVVVTSEYVDLTNCRSTGGALFKTKNSVDNGGNTGWIFYTVLQKIFLEAVTLIASITNFRGAVKTFLENVSLIESCTKKANKVFASVLSITATLPRALTVWFRQLTESIVLVEFMPKKLVRLFTDTVVLTASIVKKTVKPFVELYTLIDRFTISTTLHRTFIDGILLNETIVKAKSMYKILTEVLTITPIISTIQLILKVLTETLVMADRFVLRLNGRVTALWSRVQKATTGWTKVPKDRSTWNITTKASPEWERQQRDL